MSTPAKQQKFNSPKAAKKFFTFKKKFLEAGQRGFLATCNFREKDCVRECLNILTQYADKLYGPQEATSSPSEDATNEFDDDDIADDLQKQIDATKQKGKGAPKKRFQMVETGATNCVFIRTTLPNPVEVVTQIVKDIAKSGEAKSRYLLRLVPVEAVCHANLGDITKAGGAIFDKYFLKEPSTFAIVCNKRLNNVLKRDDIIHDLASLVHEKNVGNRVDLKHADKTVVVEVIKGLCCISVVEGYLQHRKYNLVELAKDIGAKDEKNAEAANIDKTKNPEAVKVVPPKQDEPKKE